MRVPLATLLLLVLPTVIAQTRGKPGAVSACSTELGSSTLTIYVPVAGNPEIEGRPIPEARLDATVMHLLDTGEYKTVLLLIAPDATYARAQKAVDQTLNGSRGLPLGAIQLTADGNNSHLRCLSGQHSTDTTALQSVRKVPKPIAK